MQVANRICEATNTIGAARSTGMLDDAFTAHHLAKAKGGTAWIGHETWLLNSPLPPHAAMEFHPGSGTVPVHLHDAGLRRIRGEVRGRDPRDRRGRGLPAHPPQ